MLELVKSGGWLMWPILLSSVVALGIAIERLWTLRQAAVAPTDLLNQLLLEFEQGALSKERLHQFQLRAPLGQILVAGIEQSEAGRDQWPAVWKLLAFRSCMIWNATYRR